MQSTLDRRVTALEKQQQAGRAVPAIFLVPLRAADAPPQRLRTTHAGQTFTQAEGEPWEAFAGRVSTADARAPRSTLVPLLFCEVAHAGA